MKAKRAFAGRARDLPCGLKIQIGFAIAVLFTSTVQCFAAQDLALPDACNGPQASRLEIAGVDISRDGAIVTGTGEIYLQADILAGGRFSGAEISEGGEFAPYMFHWKAKRTDRWERKLGDLVELESGAWLAAKLVASGAALVDPRTSTVDCLTPLLALEGKARAGRKGLWRRFSVLPASDPDAISRMVGHFALVEGRVVSVGRTRRTHYLNFGYRWSRDFTATIDVGRETAFDAAGVDIAALEGQRVRLRGFVTLDRGPLLVLDHPAQLEQLTSGSDVGK
ncbi:hypothetical protein HPQ64_04460 [Rhizobiales bacterium]|uniref:hypothetical protein n=1 Tax=Hongsoonwoonella zoysiae TaxID=2821844 RepID=UPI00156179E9|nr:hypothetical protein [Hongsoonwoonella zoysiae]NRG16933.1 hypothetical protein [Hongsoonwoonella zoysiae]